MPQDIERAFAASGASACSPSNCKRWRCECSCTGQGAPCKHVSARSTPDGRPLHGEDPSVALPDCGGAAAASFARRLADCRRRKLLVSGRQRQSRRQTVAKAEAKARSKRGAPKLEARARPQAPVPAEPLGRPGPPRFHAANHDPSRVVRRTPLPSIGFWS